MVVVGDYLWSAIRPGKFLRVLKSDLNNFSEISTGMETAGEWTRAGVYAGGGYVWTCNSGSPSLLAQIEPNTLEVRTYNFPIGQGLCQSIQGDSQNLYFAFYQSPGKVSAVSLSSLINTTDSVPPTTPTNLTATTTTSSQINLSWTASTDNVGVTGYKVYRKTGTNPFTQIASTTITNYQDTTLTAETTYSYTVSAYDLAGNNSPQSLAVSASTLVPPPPPVISIGSRIQTTDRVKVRTTPTTKGKALCTQPLGVLGTVVGGPTTASGYKWWNVNYDSSCDGWSVENYIKPL
jgi:chitodextrinase